MCFRFLREVSNSDLELVLDFHGGLQLDHVKEDTFHKLLHDYLGSRKGLADTKRSIDIKTLEAEEQERQLWAFVEKKSEMKGKCHDGKEVESTQIYKVSEFKATAATSLRSVIV